MLESKFSKYGYIKNCPITHTDAMIIRPWEYSTDDFHTGIDLFCDRVYSICSGVVIELDKSIDNTYVVTVQYTDDIIVRYLHLAATAVAFGQIVKIDDIIGTAEEYVHFEYATKQNSMFSVRLSNALGFFKHDPYEVAAGIITLLDSGMTDYEPPEHATQTIF